MDVSLSLDEIIQKKKKTNGARNGNSRFLKQQNQRPNQVPKKTTKRFVGGGGVTKNKPIIDARNKIIQKNRSKIRDARDKLVQLAKRGGDARLKLMKKQAKHQLPVHRMAAAPVRKPQRRLHTDMLLEREAAAAVAAAYRHRDDLMDVDDHFIPAPLALRRTVKNEIAMMPPLPTFKVQRQLERRPQSSSMWSADPFDCYEVPTERPADVSEPRHLQRTIRNPELDVMPRGILRSSRALSPHRSSRALSPPPIKHGSYIPDENSHLSYEMRTRLKNLPDTNVSMGMFSNPYAKLQQPKNNGYRIVVSNLHDSVSQSDIKELFEDIGTLLEARVVRPGVAEVIYASMKDAETAVDTYHNRQLDGQPMKCLLVNPRSQNKPTAPAIKRSSIYGNANKSSTTKSLEVDIDALHSVLFRQH